MTDDSVSVERSDRVVICSLDDPDARNALTAEAAVQLRDAVTGIEDTGARCVLLRGEGAHFCASGDVGAHVSYVRGEMDRSEWRERLDAVAGAVAAVHDCPVPTVAAVDGTAFGTGACLALACDLRLASTDATIGFGFRRFGLAATAGASYLLPRVVGPDVALELLYTGSLVGADRAAELGLFTRLLPSEGYDDALASVLADISTGPASAMRAAKALCRADFAALDAALEAETETQRVLVGSDDFEEGVTAFAQQRDPQF